MNKPTIFKTIESEIKNYQDESVDLSDGVKFSQCKLVKRISLYENQIYPKGKTDSQGNYKYWYDIITPRVNDELKNIDFDRSNILLYSDSIKDRLAVYISNLWLKSWLTTTGQGEELNDAVEEFSSWGNVVWKKIKGGYERVDLKNFYVINQTAKSLDDTAVIERHLLTQSDLRAKKGVWKNIDETIKDCGNKQFAATEKSTASDTSNPFYEIYERNGEVSEAQLKEAQGKSGGDEEKYILAKIVLSGLNSSSKKDGKYTLYAEEISEMPYRETHRGRYRGSWFRDGLYSVLFDCQTRANEIGNQVAKGLEWASKTIFKTADDTFVQNILTDLRNGDTLRSRDISQVEVRMQGLDQMMVDWNRNLQVADRLANSYEVVQGDTMPSNTPFRLGAMLNQNANKLFDFLREKLALGFQDLIQDWILPAMMKDLKAQKVIDLTNSEENLKDYYKMVIDAWYIKNLPNLPPHSPEIAQTLKDAKTEEIMKDKKATIVVEQGFWDNFKPRVKVVITGENVQLASELESMQAFIALEADPIRRTALIEMAMAKKNIDTSNLPKTPPLQPEQIMQAQQGRNAPQPNAIAAESANQASIGAKKKSTFNIPQ